jgi:lysyl-tRNA synthetase class 2
MSEPPPAPEVSKNALKKQQKAEELAKRKAEKEQEKAAAKALEPVKAGKLGGDDEELDPTQYFDNRVKAIAQLEEGGTSAFPHKFHATLRVSEYIARFESLADGVSDETVSVSVSGRVLSKRGQGKLMFYDLHSEGDKIQIMSDLSRYEGGEEAFQKIHSLIKRGDIVGVVGAPGKSKKGELSIFPTSIQLLSPCFHMLPKVLKPHYKTYKTYYKTYQNL